MVHVPQPNTFEEVYAGIYPTGKQTGRVLKLGGTIDTIIECNQAWSPSELVEKQDAARAQAEALVNGFLAPYLKETGMHIHLDRSVLENAQRARSLAEITNPSQTEQMAVKLLGTFNKLSAEQKSAIEASLRLMGKAAYYGNDIQIDPLVVIAGIANILAGLPIEQLGATPNKIAKYHNGELTIRDEISRLIETSEKYRLSPSMIELIAGPLSNSASAFRACLSATDTIEPKDRVQYRLVRKALEFISGTYNSNILKSPSEAAEYFNSLIPEIINEVRPATYHYLAYFQRLGEIDPENRGAALEPFCLAVRGFDFAGKRGSGVKRVIMIGADGSRHDLQLNGGTEYKKVILEAANACLCKLPISDPLYDITSKAIRNIAEHI
ncbi:hypothetical protein HYU11_00745 [Candidatus Woesearchaeota archaeon]|nr:hypothetical protein [Candidatus Woesearchaeota archaeon]